MTAAGRLRVGTSGYQYDHWRGVLYPADLPKRRWLARYCESFDCVEINNTFYSLPGEATFDAWHDAAPAGFRYALKLSRYATHMKKLREPQAPLARFLARAERLGRLLGPILVQLPPGWHRDRGRLADFLACAPRRHLWAVEFRDPTWLHPEIFQLLADHGAALVVHDLLDDHPRERTASFVYRRFHGPARDARYSPQKLAAEARWLRGLSAGGVDAWVFFNNDAGGAAVHDASALRRYLGVEPPRPGARGCVA